MLGEPVGSCTDLSAAIMQPLKERHGETFEVAPLSVLIDVRQVGVLASLRAAAEQAQPSRFPDNLHYIYEKQLEEADAIVLNKADLLAVDELNKLKDSLTPGSPTRRF